MTANQKRLATRIGIAVLFVVWIVLRGIGTYREPSAINIAFTATPFLVLLLVWARENRRTMETFAFYVKANEILVQGEGNHYYFERAEVIKTGEKIVRSMPDAPPLARFTLGALCYSIDNFSCAAEQLAMAAEEEVLKESEHASPSPQLRRYVKKLRKIERRPKRYAKFNAAIASLERMHQERAGRLLAESQNHLRRLVESADLPLKSITAAPTISEVLNEVYQ